MTDSIYAIGMMSPVATADDIPPGLAITSIVGKAFSIDEISAFVLDLHRCMANGQVPLEHHWPPAGYGWVWKLVPVGSGTPTTPPPWWAGLPAPMAQLATPIKVKARLNCRVWKVTGAINYDTLVPMVAPFMTLTDRRVMDVFAVYHPANAPAWFTVWESGQTKMVCLADETEDA